MLSQLRKGAGTWVAKIFIGILILSFAVWGVEGLLQGNRDTALAKVGDIEITRADYQKLFPNVVQQWGQRFKTTLTRQQIQAFGIPDQVKNQLIMRAVVENHGHNLKLDVSDEKIGQIIQNTPELRDNTGQFNKELLKQILRNERLSEAEFFNEQRSQSLRAQLTSVFSQKKHIPDVLVNALYHHREDKLEIEYFAIPEEAIEKTKEPTEADLKSFFEKSKNNFVAPEYRKAALYVLSLDELKNNTKVSEDDIKKTYEARKKSFISPETRTYQQVVFETKEKALEAHKALQNGDKFEDVAKKFGRDEKFEEIGPVTKTAMADPKLSKAVFDIKEGEATAPVEGTFAITIAKVTKVKAREEKTLEDVRADLEKLLQDRSARKDIKSLYDKVEDLRASGMSVEETAKEMGAKAIMIDALDQKGAGLDGKPVKDLPATSRLIPSVFDAAIGDDTIPVRHKDGGYVWFDVLKIDPKRNQTFDEVKDKVKEQWLADEQKKLASKYASQLAKKIEDGEPFEKAAESIKAKIETPKAFGRGAEVQELPIFFVNRLFGVKADSITTGLDSTNKKWLVVKVKKHVPAKTEGPAFEAYKTKLDNELQAEMTEDLISQYLDGAKNQFGVEENKQVFDQLKSGL